MRREKDSRRARRKPHMRTRKAEENSEQTNNRNERVDFAPYLLVVVGVDVGDGTV
jgi:hypothetical protein